MKIAFVCNEYPPSRHGGIGTCTRVLARELVQRGHEVRVVGAYEPNQAEPAYQDDDGVQVWRLATPAGRMGWLKARYQVFRTLHRWTRDGLVEIIEVPDWGGWAAVWPRLPVPVVARLNGSATYFAAELGRQVDAVTKWFERASFRRADYWCAVSDYTARKSPLVLGEHPYPGTVLFNPVNLPELRAAERARPVAIFTGTLAEKKGIVSLIRAWPLVLTTCPDAELHVYGKEGRTADGQPMFKYLRSLLDPEARQTVRLLGHQSRETIYEALHEARVAVFPSYAEAFALAPLEAMACGCPTIYSQRGSGPELITPGVDGLLVDPDDVDDIAHSLIHVFTDDDLARRLGAAGRKRVEQNFSTTVMAHANEAFYRHCIDCFHTRQNDHHRPADSPPQDSADDLSDDTPDCVPFLAGNRHR